MGAIRSNRLSAERFLFCPAKPRISAGGASHPKGSVGLGNWRGSRLHTVYRGIEIGAEVGKCRASFTGLDPPGLGRRRWPMFAGFGSSTVGFGRRGWVADSNPSINTHGVGTYKYSSVSSWAARGNAVRLFTDSLVTYGKAKTSIALPDFGCRISGANSEGISVDQLPPPVPAGMAMYCFPFARYVIGNP